MTASRVIPILTLSYMIGSTVALGSIMCKGINNCFVSKHETDRERTSMSCQQSLSVPTYPPPKKIFIADLHESQDPSFLKKTAAFPQIRGESSCLIYRVPIQDLDRLVYGRILGINMMH